MMGNKRSKQSQRIKSYQKCTHCISDQKETLLCSAFHTATELLFLFCSEILRVVCREYEFKGGGGSRSKV
jgi:hypothetical protein